MYWFLLYHLSGLVILYDDVVSVGVCVKFLKSKTNGGAFFFNVCISSFDTG